MIHVRSQNIHLQRRVLRISELRQLSSIKKNKFKYNFSRIPCIYPNKEFKNGIGLKIPFLVPA